MYNWIGKETEAYCQLLFLSESQRNLWTVISDLQYVSAS